MHMNFLPSRLKTARKIKGLSLQQLTDALGFPFSKHALQKIESGLAHPESTQILSLADVLDLPPNYFIKRDPLALGLVEWPKLKGIPSKKQESIKSKTIEYLDRYLELEDIVG